MEGKTGKEEKEREERRRDETRREKRRVRLAGLPRQHCSVRQRATFVLKTNSLRVEFELNGNVNNRATSQVNRLVTGVGSDHQVGIAVAIEIEASVDRETERLQFALELLRSERLSGLDCYTVFTAMENVHETVTGVRSSHSEICAQKQSETKTS